MPNEFSDGCDDEYLAERFNDAKRDVFFVMNTFPDINNVLQTIQNPGKVEDRVSFTIGYTPEELQFRMNTIIVVDEGSPLEVEYRYGTFETIQTDQIRINWERTRQAIDELSEDARSALAACLVPPAFACFIEPRGEDYPLKRKLEDQLLRFEKWLQGAMNE